MIPLMNLRPAIDATARAAADHEIGCGVQYPVPLHLHPTFAGCGVKRGDLPHAERAAREVLSLPTWPYLSDSDVLQVAEKVRGFFTKSC